MFLLYLCLMVRQAQENLHAKYKEMEKELAKYKESVAAFPATPPTPNQVVPTPKVVSSRPRRAAQGCAVRAAQARAVRVYQSRTVGLFGVSRTVELVRSRG